MPARHFQYAVFLSHNRAQKDWTRELARRLRDDGFKVWFDEWVLPQHAGRNWITPRWLSTSVAWEPCSKIWATWREHALALHAR